MESLVISTKQTLIDKLGRLNIILPQLEADEQIQFDQESERINRLQEEQADRLVSELKSQIQELDEQFDYKEALTPKKSLEELCREIGLK